MEAMQARVAEEACHRAHRLNDRGVNPIVTVTFQIFASCIPQKAFGRMHLKSGAFCFRVCTSLTRGCEC